MSKDFSKNITPKKKTQTSKKPTDSEIEKALDKQGKKTIPKKSEQTTFNLRLPLGMHEELKETATRTGISMAAIIKQGILTELRRLNQ